MITPLGLRFRKNRYYDLFDIRELNSLLDLNNSIYVGSMNVMQTVHEGLNESDR